MHCNHLRSPGLCKVFELGIDRPNEVELLFPSDGWANVLVAFKIEQTLAAIDGSETFHRALLYVAGRAYTGCR